MTGTFDLTRIASSCPSQFNLEIVYKGQDCIALRAPSARNRSTVLIRTSASNTGHNPVAEQRW